MSTNSDIYQKITYYKLPENYHYYEDVDVTKFDSLTGDEVDANFFVLEGRDISSIEISEDRKKLILNLVNGSTIESDNIFGNYIETLSFDYDDEDGILTVCINDCEEEPLKVEGFLTLKDVARLLEDFYIHTDNTLTGNGSLDAPLSIAASHRTGMIKPIDDVVAVLPENPIIGSRYLMAERIDCVGRFYNFSGLFDIMNALEENGSKWRIASKDDWDEMLNYLEIPLYKDHNKPIPSKWLGQKANIKLKNLTNFGLEYCGYVFDDDEKSVSFKDEKASFWCNTNTFGKPVREGDTQAWVKQFKGGDHPDGRVYQTLVDNAIFSSVRLVKDIEDGETVDAAEILGNIYPVTVMRSADGKNKMWITSNLDYDTRNYHSFKSDSSFVTKPFINEWDGEKWIKYSIEGYTTFMIKSANALYYITDDGHIKPVDNDVIERIATLENDIVTLENRVTSLEIMVANYHKPVQTKLEEARAYVYDPQYEYKGEFEFGEDTINYTINIANIGEGGRNIMNDFARLLGGLYRTNKVEPIQFNYKYYDWDDNGDNKGSNYKLMGESIRQENSLVTAIVAAYMADPTQVFKIKFDNTVVNTTITVVNE